MIARNAAAATAFALLAGVAAPAALAQDGGLYPEPSSPDASAASRLARRRGTEIMPTAATVMAMANSSRGTVLATLRGGTNPVTRNTTMLANTIATRLVR